MTQKIDSGLSKFFLVYLFINPLLDILGGYLLNTKALGSFSLSLYLRMGVLVLMGIYILMRRDWRSVMLLIPVGAASVLSIITEIICQFERFNLFYDVQYIAKFIYNLAAYIVYSAVLYGHYHNKEKMLALLDRAFVWMAAWVSGSILVSFVLQVGFSTYTKRSMGAKGFFYSGNEATALLIIIFPLLLRCCLKVKFDRIRMRDIGLVLVTAMTTCALLLLGTKTSLAALILSIALIVLYVIVESIIKRNVTRLYALLTVLGAMGLLYLGMELLSNNDFSKSVSTSMEVSKHYLDNPVESYKPSESAVPPSTADAKEQQDARLDGAKDGLFGKVARLLSGRTAYLRSSFHDWLDHMPLTGLFGVARGSRGHTIEMDIFEVFFYYGLFGFFFLCWPYVRQACGMLKRFLRKWDFDGYCAVIAIGTMTGYLFLAGHVLFTVTGGFYYALVLLYACIHYDVTPMALPRWIERFTDKLVAKLPAAKS